MVNLNVNISSGRYHLNVWGNFFALTALILSAGCGSTDFVGRPVDGTFVDSDNMTPTGSGDQSGVLEETSDGVDPEEPLGHLETQGNDLNLLQETFIQGLIWEEVEDFSQINIRNVLDILVVIDNSSSMLEEQLNLSSKLAPLLSHVANSDWRIGITTTDPVGVDHYFGTADDCMVGVLTPETENYEEVFRLMIEGVGTSGAYNEMGINGAIAALKGECLGGKNWLRKDSAIAIIIISDEDNCSDGKSCPNNENDLINYLRSIRSDPEKARIYAIIGKDTPSDKVKCPYDAPGDTYIKAVAATGGIYGDICDKDYTKVLKNISRDISSLLIDEFVLRQSPLAKIQVYENNEEISLEHYEIHGSTIKFLKAPANGAEIKVKYLAGKKEAFVKLALKKYADPTSLKIYFNDDEEPLGYLTDYVFNEDGKTIEFLNIPPTDTKIKVTYKKLEENYKAKKD